LVIKKRKKERKKERKKMFTVNIPRVVSVPFTATTTPVTKYLVN
jgi:hypothetical protein